MRYFLELSYLGTHYHGWQSQPNALGVQAVIEEKLTILLRQPINIVGSGRTDTGVHAAQQYAHFDYEQPLRLSPLVRGLNALLPSDIAIHEIHPVEPEAHARFDATSRSYRYVLSRQKNPFLQQTAYQYDRPLDLNGMNQAAKILYDITDFESFSKVHTDVKTFNCVVYEAYWEVQTEDVWVFHITANRFLRGMVRAIVGTLLEVGLGKISLPAFERIIAKKDRRQASAAAPPQGLSLCRVKYPYL
ncbi:tRNA pseudouridine(38-40) synthase TruA [Eisenibacter elegans]|uniref:tRNA pseudouridine(38-40) synthase TruA n=1 Tax=Eisenibacter elegans TaxID=997 RepID=UPI00041C33CA|nr:tRNA pseudouridine(38-40) synthase TruA [Eisenibacter elegans]